jgi:hypothetical protein
MECSCFWQQPLFLRRVQQQEQRLTQACWPRRQHEEQQEQQKQHTGEPAQALQ